MEIMRRTPWLRIKGQNSVYKEFLQIVGNVSSTGSLLEETSVVSATISISVEKVHHQIRLRILTCGRMSEKHREPEVPEVRALAVECHDGFARITLEELAITHFVKNGTLQNACTTRPRVVVGLGKSPRMHTVRLMNSRLKGPKKNDDKSAVALLKKGDWHESIREPGINYVTGHDRAGRPDEKRDYELKRGPTGRRSSNARQLRCVFQDMKPPKSILRKSIDMQRPIQRVKFTKAIARHTYIRDQNPSLGCLPGEPHQRISNAPKFQDRSQEETEWQEQGAREATWKLVKSVSKYRSKREQHSSYLRKIGACLHQILNLRNETLLSTPERQCI